MSVLYNMISVIHERTTFDAMQRDHLKNLENHSVYIIREAYANLQPVAALWSMGKDSTVLIWLIRKAFFGRLPFPIVHVDTSLKLPGMIAYRDMMAREWGAQLVVGMNNVALTAGTGPENGRVECCTQLKTEALQAVIKEHGFKSILLGIRRDEEGTRAKERIFSPRNIDFEWNFKDQPPELWDQFQTFCPHGAHIRVHPLLSWSEIDVWEYIEMENIPVIDLYFARNGRRYRSLGCQPCTGDIASNATTVSAIIEELKSTKRAEREGRKQDQAAPHAMQKLRAKGYM